VTTRQAIASALYDLMGFLTGRKEVLVVGASEDCVPAISALREWAKLRGLNIEDEGIDPRAWEQVE